MAVQTWIYGNPEVQYEGCVLDTYEYNGRWDSDWYAICWDREKQQLVEVEYDTTRCGGGGRAEIDATPEVLREVYRCNKAESRQLFDSCWNISQAKKLRVGDTVRVVKGRKVPKGTVGKVFWVGTCYNRYSRTEDERIGIEVDGHREFLSAEYVEVLNWESRLIRGRERKRRIRNDAVNAMPVHFRRFFTDVAVFMEQSDTDEKTFVRPID